MVTPASQLGQVVAGLEEAGRLSQLRPDLILQLTDKVAAMSTSNLKRTSKLSASTPSLWSRARVRRGGVEVTPATPRTALLSSGSQGGLDNAGFQDTELLSAVSGIGSGESLA